MKDTVTVPEGVCVFVCVHLCVCVAGLGEGRALINNERFLGKEKPLSTLHILPNMMHMIRIFLGISTAGSSLGRYLRARNPKGVGASRQFQNQSALFQEPKTHVVYLTSLLLKRLRMHQLCGLCTE